MIDDRIAEIEPAGAILAGITGMLFNAVIGVLAGTIVLVLIAGVKRLRRTPVESAAS